MFNPAAYEVNVGDASAALPDAGLGEGPIYAKTARYRAAQLPERCSNLGAASGQLLSYYGPPVEVNEGRSAMRSRSGRFEAGAGTFGHDVVRHVVAIDTVHHNM
jgi:hypothetical protein